jgi:parvulin-like peptidyl-prolyl isomerase
MSTVTSGPTLLLAGLLAATAASCGSADKEPAGDRPPAESAAAAEVPDDALALVNGVPITVADVELASTSKGAHDKGAAAPSRKNVLETVIRQELVRQRAVELGLDKDPQFRRKLSRMQAQLDMFQRGELGELFFRDEVRGKADIDAQEARKYFEEHEQRIRLELHVWQILIRDEAGIEQAKAELDDGAPFEQVAAKQFPKLPEGKAPWDLGYLKWKQVPEAWQDVIYDLEPGQVSDIISGPRNRFWIIKLIDRRENAELTFENVEQIIGTTLRSQKIEQLHEQAAKDLKDRAEIQYLEPKPSPHPELEQ